MIQILQKICDNYLCANNCVHIYDVRFMLLYIYMYIYNSIYIFKFVMEDCISQCFSQTVFKMLFLEKQDPKDGYLSL